MSCGYVSGGARDATAIFFGFRGDGLICQEQVLTRLKVYKFGISRVLLVVVC